MSEWILDMIRGRGIPEGQADDIQYRILDDGVHLWQHSLSATQKPWFFRQLETLFNLIFPSKESEEWDP